MIITISCRWHWKWYVFDGDDDGGDNKNVSERTRVCVCTCHSRHNARRVYDRKVGRSMTVDRAAVRHDSSTRSQHRLQNRTAYAQSLYWIVPWLRETRMYPRHTADATTGTGRFIAVAAAERDNRYVSRQRNPVRVLRSTTRRHLITVRLVSFVFSSLTTCT